MDGRTSGRALRADERTGGRADERTGADNGRTGGRIGGLADGRTSGRGRMGGQRIFKGKTPDLTRHLTRPWEIQRGRPWVTVKLPDLPPPSR